MKVKLLQGKEYKTIGYIYMKDHEVVLDFTNEDDAGYFREVTADERPCTPADGPEYLKALVNKFSYSLSLVLVKEERDREWISMVRVQDKT